MFSIRFFLLLFVVTAEYIKNTFLKNYDVNKAISMVPTDPEDYTFKYFLQKRFNNDLEGAVLTILSADKNNTPVLLLLSHMNSKKTPMIKMASSDVISIFSKMASEVSIAYLENKYNFYISEAVYMNDSSDMADVLTTVWSRNSDVVKKFFAGIANNRIKLKDVENELKFLGKHGNKKVFGLLGDIYYYGLGRKIDFQKAMKYYLKGKKLNDVRSYLGIGKILMSDGYADDTQASSIFEEGLQIEKDTEMMYQRYLLLKKSNGNPHECKKMLQYCAFLGYLPAVYEMTNENHKHAIAEQAIHSFKSVTAFSPFFLKTYDEAYQAYKEKDYKKAIILYLYLAEFDMDLALKNALYIMKRHDVIEGQKKIRFNLLFELSKTNSEYYKDLGDCYYLGEGTEQSYTKAFGYYLSSINYSDESLYNVAYMVEIGKGVPRNLDQALMYIFKPISNESSYLVFLYAKLRICLKLVLYRYLNHYVIAGIAVSTTFLYFLLKKTK